MRRLLAIIPLALLLTACSIHGRPVAVAENVALPDVVGLAGDVARDELEDLGLDVEWDAGDSFVVLASNWTVDAQSPAAGAVVVPGTTITLTVSKHEEEEAVEEEPTEQAPAAPTLTMGQQQAIGKAQDYLAYMAFSRTGLIGQLEFEGFSTDDATFAVDSLGVDWNAQAALKAQDYLDTMSFSRQGLIDQLVFEGFTQDEATYGVTAVGY